MFSQVLKQAFWDTYDHLGRLVLLNILLVLTLLPLGWAMLQGLAIGGADLALVPGVLLFVLGAAAICFLLGTPWLSGLLHFGHLVSEEKDPSVSAFATGWKACGKAVASSLGLILFVGSVLLLNAWFYLFSGMLPDGLAVVGGLLGGLCGWLTLTLAAIALHVLPLAARDRHPPLKALKLGALLTLKFPGATFLTLLFIVSLLILGTVLRFAGILIYGFFMPVVLMNSLHDVVVDVLQREEEAARIAEEGESAPRSWKEIEEQEKDEEETRLRRARYDRGFRDILRPWEM